MEEEKQFDVYQGHGGHNKCLDGYENITDFWSEYLPKTIQEGGILAQTERKVTMTDLDEEDVSKEGAQIQVHAALLGNEESPRLVALIAMNEAAKTNQLVSCYPEYDGAEVQVRLTEIHEWAGSLEATLEGETQGTVVRPISFFDTRYAFNKHRYQVGEVYTFKLAAFGYRAEVLTEAQRTFSFEGEKAVQFLERCGKTPELNDDGSVKPVIFHLDELVALFQSSVACPDDAEFQSPILSEVETFEKFGGAFKRFEIAIAREDDDLVKVPMVIKTKALTGEAKQGDPICGMLWLQGYFAEV